MSKWERRFLHDWYLTEGGASKWTFSIAPYRVNKLAPSKTTYVTGLKDWLQTVSPQTLFTTAAIFSYFAINFLLNVSSWPLK